jgi:hypothetical protein
VMMNNDEEEYGSMNMVLREPGRGHFYVSLIKSVVRIAAGVCLIMIPTVWTVTGWEGINLLAWCGGLLIGAEVLGILEEIV